MFHFVCIEISITNVVAPYIEATVLTIMQLACLLS